MRLVRIDINTDTDCFGCTHRFWHWHTSLASRKTFATESFRLKMFWVLLDRLKLVWNLRQKLRCIFLDFEQISWRIIVEVANCFADVLDAIDLRLIFALPCFNVNHWHSCVESSEILHSQRDNLNFSTIFFSSEFAYQIRNVRYLNCIVHHLSSSTSVPLIEHGFIYNYCCFYIFCRITNIAFITTSSVCILTSDKSRVVLLTSRITPFEISGIRTTFVLFRSGFKYDMWMLLLEQSGVM